MHIVVIVENSYNKNEHSPCSSASCHTWLCSGLSGCQWSLAQLLCARGNYPGKGNEKGEYQKTHTWTWIQHSRHNQNYLVTMLSTVHWCLYSASIIILAADIIINSCFCTHTYFYAVKGEMINGHATKQVLACRTSKTQFYKYDPVRLSVSRNPCSGGDSPSTKMLRPKNSSLHALMYLHKGLTHSATCFSTNRIPTVLGSLCMVC